MTWEPIAGKEFREAKATRSVRAVVGLLVLVCVAIAYVLPIDDWAVTTSDFATASTGGVGLLVPLLGIVLGYKAIVGERESGSLVLVLSLPHTRRDVMAGKVLGRGAVLVAGIAIALAIGEAFVVYPYGSLAPLAFLSFLLLTVGLGTIFLGLGVAISAAVRTELTATIGGFGVFALFAVLWEGLQDGLELLLEETGLFGGTVPAPLLFLVGSEPVTLYTRLVTAFFGDGPDPTFGTNPPGYASEWVALVVFALWLVVPLLVGYWRFEVSEL